MVGIGENKDREISGRIKRACVLIAASGVSLVVQSVILDGGDALWGLR
jgi:L-lysine 2,3-aminomutase